MKEKQKPKIFAIKKQGAKHTRRDFLKGSLIAGCATLGAGLLAGCDKDDKQISEFNSLYVETLDNTSGVNTVSINKNLMASGCDDNTIRIWSISNGNQITILKGHSGKITSICFSPNGQFIATGSIDGEVKLWQVENWKLLKTMEENCHYVRSLCFSANSETLAATALNDIYLWSVSTKELIHTLQGHKSNSICFSPDGTVLASGGDDSEILLWSVTEAQITNRIQVGVYVFSICFSKDGNNIIAGCAFDTLNIWSYPDGNLLKKIEDANNAYSIDINFEGNIIATSQWPRDIQLWEMSSGELIQTLEGHSSDVNAVKFSSDGKILVSGSSDNTVRLWKMPDAEAINFGECSCDTVCTCDTVSEAAGEGICTCNSVESCTCNEVCGCNTVSSGGGGSYYYPN